MDLGFYIFLYIIVAIAVVIFSIILSNFVDLLDKKTKLSGALLGGILLAAVTSLPELFTSISATLIVHDNQLVVGNILGSDLFNIALFFIIYVIFFSKFVKAKVNKTHIITMLFCGALYIVVTLACFVFDNNKILWGWFNPLSILILAIYCLSIILTPKVDEAEDKATNSKLTVKQIVVLFILFSILLIGSSIGMTVIVDKIVSLSNIGSTFGGALFLGVATSLPELTATITLSKKGNHDAAIGDIVGSCVFNFIILSIADLLSFGCKNNTLYKVNQSTFLLLVCGGVSIIFTLLSLIYKYKGKLKNNISNRTFYIFISTILLGSYITFLVLSNINLNLAFAPF